MTHQSNMESPVLYPPDTTTDTDILPLTVRFSASIPDLLLDIPSPSTTTAAGLKQLIRSRLPRDLSTHRLRLIYAGRGLEDVSPLSVSLKLHLQPKILLPPPQDTNQDGVDGKGKKPVRDAHRVYVHCSIGDIILSEDELSAEVAVSSTLLLRRQEEKEQRKEHLVSTREQGLQEQDQEHENEQAPSTTPAPRGFDRLLATGFTPAEVSALRSQFLAIQSVTRTPDTMPTGPELRELEDRWMDEGTTAAATAGLGDGAGGDGAAFGADDDGGFGVGSRGAIDDMLWGAVMGFFWPVGCVMWLRREEGVWSWRKGLTVFVGVIVNAAFGVMRVTG